MERIKHYRETRGWTRSELARRARMAPADVGKIEAGRVVPYESQLRKLARALGVQVDELTNPSAQVGPASLTAEGR